MNSICKNGTFMAPPQTKLWKIDPHTKAKHEILRRYLGAWFGILGQKIPRIVYIDGFCGPGEYECGEPGSPLIALQQATPLATKCQNTEFVFIFIDDWNNIKTQERAFLPFCPLLHSVVHGYSVEALLS